MKLSIFYLNLNGTNAISDDSLSQFKNLTKLNLKNTSTRFDLTTFKHLTSLKLCHTSLKNVIYSGCAKVYSKKYMYCGEISSCDINGYGTYRFKNGDIHQGNFLNGKQHGDGKYQFLNGSIYEGCWNDGLLHGKATIILENGTKKHEIWCYGEQLK
jgi:hypothetical protein